MNEIMTHGISAPQGIDLSATMQSWFRFIEGSERTVETYTRAVGQFYKWTTANSIDRPTKEDIRAYRDYLKEYHKASTTQNYIMALRQFFKWTAEEGLYPDIAQNVKGMKIDNTDHKRDELSTAQIKTLLASIDRTTARGKRDYAIIVLMITTGLRVAEVARADIGDLRTLGDISVLFYRGKGKAENNTEFKKVPPKIEQVLREYLQTRQSPGEEEPLFTSTAHRNVGERLTTRSISRIVKERLKDAGLDSPRLTAHSLRHTCATQNLLRGGSIEETQQLLNHSNISTTMIYAHHLDKIKRKAEERIAEAILD